MCVELLPCYLLNLNSLSFFQEEWTQDVSTGFLYHPKRQLYHDPSTDKYFRLDLHTSEFRELKTSKKHKGGKASSDSQPPALKRHARSSGSGGINPTADTRTPSSLSNVTQDEEATMHLSEVESPVQGTGFKSQAELLPLRFATETWTGRKDDNEDR